jgi:hypothetical protein
MARKKSSAQTTTALPSKKERLGKIQDSGNAKGPRSIDGFNANQHPPPTAGDDKSKGAENFPLTKTRAAAKYKASYREWQRDWPCEATATAEV